LKRSVLTVLLATSLFLPVVMPVSAQSESFDQVALTNGEAYVFTVWVAFGGETASGLFDFLLNPVTLQDRYGDYLERDFENVERDGFVEGDGWHTGFRWTLEYHDIPGEAWVIPAEGKIFRMIILDEDLDEADVSYEAYFDFLRSAVAEDAFGYVPKGFTAVEEDPDCQGIGQPHPFCPFDDPIASS
ncbi:MAG TPA: hypothetical protein VD789_06745, partial [Thermomicrobiales bacterium]|nr:hypothetical protein [Thermomicrobiales bacterium]